MDSNNTDAAIVDAETIVQHDSVTTQNNTSTPVVAYDTATLIAFQDTLNTIVINKDISLCGCVDQLYSLYQIMDYYLPNPSIIQLNHIAKAIQNKGIEKFEELDRTCGPKDHTTIQDCPNYQAFQDFVGNMSNGKISEEGIDGPTIK